MQINKKNVSIIIIVGIIVSIILLNSKNIGLLAVTGFTTMSLSSAQFTSSSQFWTGQTWILGVTQGGLGQYATFTPADIDAKSGTEPQNPFTISLQSNYQSCEYPIQQDSNNIISLQKNEWACLGTSQSDASTHCSNMLYYGKYSESFTCFCIQAGNTYPTANFGSSTVYSSSTLTVSNGQTSNSLVIDTHNVTEGYVGTSVYATQVGSLNANAQPSCPVLSGNNYAYYNNGWHIINYNTWNNYNIMYLNFRTYINGAQGVAITQSALTSKLNDVNNYAYLATVSQPVYQVNILSSNINNGKVSYNLANNILIPYLTLYVKASYLGIVQPVGIPKIISLSVPLFKTGATDAKVTAVIQNIGNENANFNVYMTCPSPFSAGNIGTQSINAGNQVTVQIPIYSNVNARTSVICSLTVSALDKTVTQSFTATADPLSICQAGIKSCQTSTTYTVCNNQGTGTLTYACSSGEICAVGTDGNAYCKNQASTCSQDGEQTTLTKTCCQGLYTVGGTLGIGATCTKNNPNLINNLTIIIILAIMALISILYFGRQMGGGTYNYVIISLISGGIAYVLFLIISWLIANWLTIGITLGIAIIALIIALYFFTPYIITIVMSGKKIGKALRK